ncbi:MAG: substrate-binding domain-containing protein [Faecousia sp.]
MARELEHQLRRGLGEGQKLPTEAVLCQQYGCSRQTVRSALKVLQEKGLIVRRQGSGSYPTQAAAKPSRQIAVVLADKEEYLAPAMLRQIRKAASEAGFTVSCLETGGSWTREGEHLARLLHQRPAGIILEPITNLLGCFQEELLLKIRAAGIPLVYLNGRYSVEAPAVLTDDAMGTGLLMAHLSATGHRRVAAILKSDDSRGPERFRGLLRGAEETGLRFAPENCLWYSEQERLRLLEGDVGLLRRFQSSYRRDCSAVVCFNDELAFRLQRDLRAVHAPMSVVSFDNSYLALTRDASLTTLGLDTDCPGAAAVQTIQAQLDGKPVSDILLPWKLFTRKSG